MCPQARPQGRGVHYVSCNWPPFGQTSTWLSILQPFKDVPSDFSWCPWELCLFLSAWNQEVLSALWGWLGDDWPLAGTQSLDVAGAPSKDNGSSPRLSSDSTGHFSGLMLLPPVFSLSSWLCAYLMNWHSFTRANSKPQWLLWGEFERNGSAYLKGTFE